MNGSKRDAMSQRVLTLYERSECHLCQEMREHLACWEVRLGFFLEVVDIDREPERAGHLAVRIPVLMEGAHEICHYRLDERALVQHFAAVAPEGDSTNG